MNNNGSVDTALTGCLPRHVGIIMDGNGRWAKSRGIMRALGHKAGVDALREIIKASSDIGIEALTIYAFSTENWKRPGSEVNALFGLLIEYFTSEIGELNAKNVQIRILGDVSDFPSNVQRPCNEAMNITRDNTGLKLSIALNYGSKGEIARAARLIAVDVKAGKLNIDDIDEKAIERKLYTEGLPPLDFIIRTGGEKRLSNFLLYQAAYAELMFTDDFWPDFGPDKYFDCLKEYQRRGRRYGGLGGN